MSWPAAAGYAAMLAAAVGGFLGVRALGLQLEAPPPAVSTARFGTPAASVTADALPHVLLALVAIIVAARLLGAAFRRLQQPPVVGEVIAGILLGPTLLGRIAPDAHAFLLPPAVAPFLGVLAQVGVILFMFLVGLELDTALVRHRARASIAISHASITVPFLLGSVLALWLYPQLSTSDVPFTPFALFMGVAMSVTAFPVLARILIDRGLHRTRLGSIALACAAVDDVSAWCLLAFVVGVAQSRVGSGMLTVVLTAAYIATMFVVVRPLVRRWVRTHDAGRGVTQGAIAVVVVALLLSALVTEAIGIHAVFGAFFLGAVVPHDSRLAEDITRKLSDLVVVLLLPAFFAFTGMRTHIYLVSGLDHWLMCAVIVAVACIGKFGGSSLAARLSGLDWRDAASLGILMNTRGLMELVVLNIGLDLRVISPVLFAMLVIMALVTTFATTPVLHLLLRHTVVVGTERAAPTGERRIDAPARPKGPRS